MKRFIIAAALSLVASPAMALSINFQQGGTAAFTTSIDNGVTITNFGTNPGDPAVYAGPGTFAGAGSGVYNAQLVSGIAARPAFGSDGGYASVTTGGSFAINFAAAQVFSFVLGSLDATNSVELLFATGPSMTFTGGALNGGLGVGGNQAIMTQNGRVIFDAQGGTGIVGAIFTSGQNSFEFDNLITAAPEPATWALMIFGFGFAGWQLRQRRRGAAAAA